uniref:chitin synthase chs-2-like n=1 Tax=Styela clava TaxID=7725 RepID=UPI00193972AB|nr:chitin synthase chs-2-like [Styela clava]
MKQNNTEKWEEPPNEETKEEYLERIFSLDYRGIDSNIIQATSNVLKIPIIIVTSSPDHTQAQRVFKPMSHTQKTSTLIIGRTEEMVFHNTVALEVKSSAELPKQQETSPVNSSSVPDNRNKSQKKRVISSSEDRPSTSGSSQQGYMGTTDEAENAQANNGKNKPDDFYFRKMTEQEDEKKEGFLRRLAKKVAKYISTMIIFGIVLTGALVTKSTLFVLGNAYTQDYSNSECPYVREGRGQQYNYPKYMVMLILMSCLCFPEVIALFYSLWKIKKSGRARDEKSSWKKPILILLLFGYCFICWLVYEQEQNLVVTICAVIVLFSFVIYAGIDKNKFVVSEKTNGDPIFFKDYSRVDRRCSRIMTAFWFAAVTHCLSGLGTFFFGSMACQTLIQIPGFWLPLVLATPIMIVLSAAFSIPQFNPASLTLMDFYNLPLKYPEINDFIGWKTNYQLDDWWVLIVGFATAWLGVILLTLFLWKQNQERLERNEILFVKPIFAGSFIAESMLLNRRQYPIQESEYNKKRKKGNKAKDGSSSIPKVYLCATLWHENKQEMTQLLKSIMRLNKFRNDPKKVARDYFEFEVHILFDDAFNDGQLNEYVTKFLKLIPEAANKIKKDNSENIMDQFCGTPYGGRIELQIPGNNIIIHLKDSSKIRHRKRWSQCMYMYYILKHLHKGIEDQLKNVYILALDGDVDFQPESLTMLLDLMKKDDNVGAACGRIHPIGSGPIVWFQKFEYAVGHWLQKTTEDVLGCVLCSPGCFSLFRGTALMEPNVAGTYTDVAEGARQKIQWDQGEDRWLCTLLLKAGKKIEYCSVSDSYTFAPESFKGFYDQRRRWGPSTLANIFDILLDAKKAIKNNECISRGYIAYQMGLMAASLLGPATVVLIIQGAFQYVFNMSPIGGLMAALIPVIIFVIICYTTKCDFQILVAQILSLIYALVMMAVLVGVIGQMAENILNPTSMFMLIMIGMFGLTGILHPTEITCLLHGLMYYICVPSAFIFLVIYSYCNMHDVSWGTREDKPIKPDPNELKSPKNKTKEDKTKQELNKGNYGVGWGSLCKCAICLNDYEPIPMEEPGNDETVQDEQPKKEYPGKPTKDIDEIRKDAKYDERCKASGINWNLAHQWPYTKPHVIKVQDDEKEFWNKLISNRLSPLNKSDPKQKDLKKKLEGELKDFRNQMTAGYFFINSIWIVLTFSLTLVIQDVNITFYDKYGNAIVNEKGKTHENKNKKHKGKSANGQYFSKINMAFSPEERTTKEGSGIKYTTTSSKSEDKVDV